MSKSSALKIKLLQQAPEYFAQVAAWHHQECERQGLESSLAVRQQRLLLHVQHNVIPKTIIAIQNHILVGCVSLVNYTYRADASVLIPRNFSAVRNSSPSLGLTPKSSPTNHLAPVWLSNLFVLDEQRQQGFGNVLIEAAKKYALDFGAKELWLSASEFTDYYQKRGWEIIRKTRLGGRSVNVMHMDLGAICLPELVNA